MNSVNSRIAKLCTKTVIAFLFLGQTGAMAWQVDLSRRQTDFTRVSNESRLPASLTESRPLGLVEKVVEPARPSQDIVIMNTEKGFVPDAIHLRKGVSYRIHVVNVNENQRNVSFVLDAFSEHHNTLFGRTKTFTLTPQTDGVFSYQCPETAMQGRLVVLPDERRPASQ